MKKTEINRRLALTIGYTADRVRISFGYCEVLNDYSRMDGPEEYSGWQRFDHTDPAVIWPIAEKFDAFPTKFVDGTWFTSISNCNEPEDAQTVAATATALAVIRYVESKP